MREGSPMHLWTPSVAEERLHANFKAIAREKRFEPERKVIDKWANGFVDRDGKFMLEFQTSFNPCFWELYLFACFKALGMSTDFSYDRPDFVLSGSTGPFVAEATIASHPRGHAPEWERDLGDLAVNIERLLVLASTRISNAFVAKLEKYREQYAYLPQVKGKPFVLCISPFEQPFFFLQNDHALRRVLYAFDQPLYVDDPDTGGRIVVGLSMTSKVHKPSGADIELGYFTDARAKDISAVLFSNTATFGKVRALAQSNTPVVFDALRYNDKGTQPHHIVAMKPEYTESLLDGLHVCLNPYAAIPLDPSPFENREISIHRYDLEHDSYEPEAPDRFLLQRATWELSPGGGTPSKNGKSVKSYPKYMTPDLASWEEGVLVPVETSMSVFTDNHMGHYRGWTIVVARDQADGDWGAQAIPGEFRSLQQYISANPDTELLLAYDWFDSPEQALVAIKKRIDQAMDAGQMS